MISRKRKSIETSRTITLPYISTDAKFIIFSGESEELFFRRKKKQSFIQLFLNSSHAFESWTCIKKTCFSLENYCMMDYLAKLNIHNFSQYVNKDNNINCQIRNTMPILATLQLLRVKFMFFIGLVPWHVAFIPPPPFILFDFKMLPWLERGRTILWHISFKDKICFI